MLNTRSTINKISQQFCKCILSIPSKNDIWFEESKIDLNDSLHIGNKLYLRPKWSEKALF